jgi:hypothetical protein
MHINKLNSYSFTYSFNHSHINLSLHTWNKLNLYQNSTNIISIENPAQIHPSNQTNLLLSEKSFSCKEKILSITMIKILKILTMILDKQEN